MNVVLQDYCPEGDIALMTRSEGSWPQGVSASMPGSTALHGSATGSTADEPSRVLMDSLSSSALALQPVNSTAAGAADLDGGAALAAQGGRGAGGVTLGNGYFLSLTLLMQSVLDRLQQRAILYGQMVVNSSLAVCRQKCGWKGPGYVAQRSRPRRWKNCCSCTVKG